MADPASPPDDVYEAAARAYSEVARNLREHGPEPIRAVVDSVFKAGVAAGVAAGRTQAADDIRAHMDKHAPADGNYAQLRLRTHLGIAERVAAGPMTAAEVAQALNEMFAGGEPRG